jgi:uncharacterized OB-fold protein
MTSTQAFGEVQPGVFPTLMRYTNADAVSEPFWAAAREDRLEVQRCTQCGTFRLPPTPLCFRCRSKDSEWVELPGTGTVYASTVVRHPLHHELATVVPYVSAIVELDGTQGAGARMLVNIIDCEPEKIRIGTPVEIVWEHVNDEMSVARFRPIPGDAARRAE